MPFENVVISALTALGFELVEFRRGGSKSRPIIAVRIERGDLTPVTVDDCARASRAIEARLDEVAVLGERYELQVSSPGIERVLRTQADWRRFAGYRANVLSPALGGRVEIEIVGLEGDAGSEMLVVRDARGGDRRIPLADVREARLAFYTKR